MPGSRPSGRARRWSSRRSSPFHSLDEPDRKTELVEDFVPQRGLPDVRGGIDGPVEDLLGHLLAAGGMQPEGYMAHDICTPREGADDPCLADRVLQHPLCCPLLPSFPEKYGKVCEGYRFLPAVGNGQDKPF